MKHAAEGDANARMIEESKLHSLSVHVLENRLDIYTVLYSRSLSFHTIFVNYLMWKEINKSAKRWNDERHRTTC